MSRSKLPQTDSIEKLAKFWDTHDLTDFDDQLEEVGQPVFDRTTVVKIPMDSKQAEAVEQIAASRGITLPALVQQWINERVADL